MSADETEDYFWKNISFSPPLYGADVPHTLFDAGVKWNLNEINNLLKYGLENNLKGVNNSFCYYGSWKTCFAWHKED